jgi:hypothetical protein
VLRLVHGDVWLELLEFGVAEQLVRIDRDLRKLLDIFEGRRSGKFHKLGILEKNEIDAGGDRDKYHQPDEKRDKSPLAPSVFFDDDGHNFILNYKSQIPNHKQIQILKI